MSEIDDLRAEVERLRAESAKAFGRERGLDDACTLLRRELAEARRLLAGLQWASCDGCGRRAYCPECNADSPEYGGDGTHKPDCIVGAFLAAHPEEKP